MWESLLGVVVGGGITLFSTYLTNKMEVEKNEKTLKHEEMKLLREEKLEILNNVLKPIIGIYAESDYEIELDAVPGGYDVFGNGLQYKYVNKLKNIIRANEKIMSIELTKAFENVRVSYGYDMLSNHLEEKMLYLEQIGEIAIDCIFDENRLFINKVEQEAKEIEKKYK